MYALLRRSIHMYRSASNIHAQPKDVVVVEDQTQRTNQQEPPEDNVLMRRVAEGDEQALALLYDRYAATVLGIALKMLHQRESAEEVVQEAFWRVWQRAATFDASRGNFAPWLFGISRNLCIDALRRRRSRPQPVYEDPERPWLAEISDESIDVEASVWLADQQRVVRAALQELSTEQREALELAYFSGLTQREIAEQLGNPLGTVKTRVRLGLLKLRDLLKSQIVDD